ncbi:hypothetical protein [Paucidesulfovibrio longus]|uniref:hypothetical protein n=1 Tax=Paucidesulfovibrio longus TaxID=889 RepID=UPI0003B79551|nr:hypothetical protein [Paucidesulfovibrio longus]
MPMFRSPLIAALLLACLCLIAAAPARPALAEDEISREEALALRRAYDEQRTHEYPDVGVDKALAAAARVFELADGGYAVLIGKGGVVAHREREASLFSAEAGDYWYVDARPSGNGVVMRIRRTSEPDPRTSLDAEEQKALPGRLVDPATLDPEETWLSELTDSGAAYAIFFKRMDWLLARNNYWLYCRAAEEYVKMEKLAGTLDSLCRDAGDKRPSLR